MRKLFGKYHKFQLSDIYHGNLPEGGHEHLQKAENMKKIFKAKPFLKWAGGKTQLISEIERCLPTEIRTDKFTYLEPFAGSGAVLFWMLNNFPNLEKAVINDINSDLINAYKIIASQPKNLISILKDLQKQFHALPQN